MPGFSRLASLDQVLLPATYFCLFCRRLLKEAMQTACGHFYCLSCLENVLVEAVSGTMMVLCLEDGCLIPLHEVYEDNFRRREISTLIVRCVYWKLGCGWKGEVRRFEAHIMRCKHEQAVCPHFGCGIFMNKAALEEHMERECHYRLQKCHYCESKVQRSLLEAHHDSDCPGIAVICPKCNNNRIARGQLPGHLTDCNGVRGSCPLFEVGCPERKVISRAERERHVKKHMASHIFLLLTTVMNLVRGMATMVMSAVSFASRLIESGGPRLPANELIRRMTRLEKRISDHEVLLVETNRIADDLKQPVKSFKRQLEATEETVRRLERKVESHEHVLAIRNVALADLDEFVRQQQVSSYDGALLWKIADYARKKNDAVSERQTSIYSPFFYTSRHGYKMCARLYLNGDGIGKGTHISLFFVVMRGQYDALLPWPFRQKVTIMLLDQDNVEHVIDAFRPDLNSSSFQRPRREMNVASCCPLFCSLSELNKHAYARDDIMFIKIIVDTSDL